MSELPPDPPSGSDQPPGPTAAVPVPPGPQGGSSLPPPPGTSGPPAPSEQPTGSRRRTWLIAIGAGLAVVIGIAIVLAVTNGGSGDGLPDEVAGLRRLHTQQVQQFEDQMGSIKIGDVHIDVAAYGSQEDPAVLLILYSNLPSNPSIDAILRGAGGGIVGAGGTVDLGAETTQLRDGIEYSCLPFSGRLFPTDPNQASGQICAWSEGDDVALVMDTRTSDANEAITDSEAAHAALS